MKVMKKKTSRCPSCGERIAIGESPKIGQYLICSICDEKVEIVNLDPVILDLIYFPDGNGYAYDNYEYWDDYWEEV
jgi:lysine biosynthesis protein LysW